MMAPRECRCEALGCKCRVRVRSLLAATALVRCVALTVAPTSVAGGGLSAVGFPSPQGGFPGKFHGTRCLLPRPQHSPPKLVVFFFFDGRGDGELIDQTRPRSALASARQHPENQKQRSQASHSPERAVVGLFMGPPWVSSSTVLHVRSQS